MTEYADNQVEEIVQEAVAKTEKSFGGTFKRLKSENEDLKKKYEAAVAENDAARSEQEHRIEELENLLSESSRHISELAVRGEIQKQMREKGPVPERFIDIGSIEYSDDPEELKTRVSAAIDRGREEFESALGEIGVTQPQTLHQPANPTNPPSRDTRTAHDLKRTEARDALNDMTQRGLLR